MHNLQHLFDSSVTEGIIHIFKISTDFTLMFLLTPYLCRPLDENLLYAPFVRVFLSRDALPGVLLVSDKV